MRPIHILLVEDNLADIMLTEEAFTEADFPHHLHVANDGIDALDRVWSHANFLPSAEELDSPGRWLERMGLVGGEPIDLDEGLRRLLDGDADGPEGPGTGGA